MKNILFILVLLLTFSSYAQIEINEPVEKKNEVYLNAFNLIAFKWFDVSYEYLINEEASIGVSALVSLDEDSLGYDSYRKFSITPYYRHFFSKNYAQGFFMEAFTMINSGENYDYWYVYDEINDIYNEGEDENNYTDMAFGISVGGKFVSKRGFVGEVHAGVGRNLFNDQSPEVIGRGAISFGYRF